MVPMATGVDSKGSKVWLSNPVLTRKNVISIELFSVRMVESAARFSSRGVRVNLVGSKNSPKDLKLP